MNDSHDFSPEKTACRGRGTLPVAAAAPSGLSLSSFLSSAFVVSFVASPISPPTWVPKSAKLLSFGILFVIYGVSLHGIICPGLPLPPVLVFVTLCLIVVQVAEYETTGKTECSHRASKHVVHPENITSSAPILNPKSPHSIHVIHIYQVRWGKHAPCFMSRACP